VASRSAPRKPRLHRFGHERWFTIASSHDVALLKPRPLAASSSHFEPTFPGAPVDLRGAGGRGGRSRSRRRGSHFTGHELGPSSAASWLSAITTATGHPRLDGPRRSSSDVGTCEVLHTRGSFLSLAEIHPRAANSPGHVLAGEDATTPGYARAFAVSIVPIPRVRVRAPDERGIVMPDLRCPWLIALSCDEARSSRRLTLAPSSLVAIAAPLLPRHLLGGRTGCFDDIVIARARRDCPRAGAGSAPRSASDSARSSARRT